MTTPTTRNRRREGLPAFIISGVFLLAVVLTALLLPLVLSTDPNHQDLAHAFAGPSGGHLFGTDHLGRDILTRLVYGARPALLFTAVVVLVALLVGVSTGLIAGYHRGWFESVTDQISNIVMAIPGLIILLVVVTVFPRNVVAGAIAFGLLSTPHVFRVVRSVVLRVRTELHVDAAKVAGLSSTRIVVSDIAPRVTGPIIVQLTLAAAASLLAVTGLSFLGFGVDPAKPSWGVMIAESATYISAHPLQILPAGLMTFLTCLAFGIFGDAARDLINDRVPPAARQPSAVAQRRAEPAATADRVDAETLLAVAGRRVTLQRPTGAVDLVEDLTLSIKRGEVVGLVGESGSGKTMSARSLLGLLPRGMQATGAHWTFDGVAIEDHSPAQVAALRGKRIALVAQEPLSALDPTCSVGKLLRALIRRHDPDCSDVQARILEVLTEVRLPDPEQVAKRYPFELSGGMAQRVSIACALIGQPDLLIADEPTSALDVTVQQSILDLLRSLRERRGLAILMVTHDWGVVADLCDRVVVMYAGQVVETGAVHQVFHHPRHPYTAALLAANPESAVPHGLLPVIPGTVPDPSARPQGCYFAPRCAFATEACVQEPVGARTVDPRSAVRCVRFEELDLPGTRPRMRDSADVSVH